MKTPTIWHGRWWIADMEAWDRDFLDLVTTAHITFDKGPMGSFEFGAVTGWLDCRFSTRDGLPLVEFSWEGQDEGDPTFGRGWAQIHSKSILRGRIFFHDGDDIALEATRDATPPPKRPRKLRSA